MKGDHDGVRKVDFPGGYSKILKSADPRMLKSLQMYDKNRGRAREGKRPCTNQLSRFLARTPCCKQLFGEH